MTPLIRLDAQNAVRLSPLKDRPLNLARAADRRHAAGARRVSAARLAPTSAKVVTQFQSDSSRTDSPVRILSPQPGNLSRRVQNSYSNLVRTAVIKLMALPKAMACMVISADTFNSPSWIWIRDRWATPKRTARPSAVAPSERLAVVAHRSMSGIAPLTFSRVQCFEFFRRWGRDCDILDSLLINRDVCCYGNTGGWLNTVYAPREFPLCPPRKQKPDRCADRESQRRLHPPQAIRPIRGSAS
jgi:hypothetical protein